MTLPPNTPVLVAAAAVEQRCDDPGQGREACALMIAAIHKAARQTGCEALLQHAQQIYVPRGMWGYTDPARLVAEGIGATGARTVLAEFGVLQQSLIGDACRRIAAGELEVAIVTGGEAMYRALRARIAGVALAETVQAEAQPDAVLRPEAELWSEYESAAGLAMPVGFYAIMESALGHAQGLDSNQHRNQIADLYHGFSRIAAANPHAWKREVFAATSIRDASESNPMLAFPYTKLHNASWNVDQAAGLVFTSVGKARESGIDEAHWIYPLASTECNHMQCLSAREQLHMCPGAGASARAAYAASGLGPAEISHWELYSCFPVAVAIYAREAGVPADTPLTITGGMPFAGGPLNNFVLQATVRMVETLHAEGGTGMVSSVSGMLTKQAWGLWSKTPATTFRFVDVTEEVRGLHPGVQLVGDYSGEGTVAGCTVLYVQGRPDRAVAVIDTPDGKRCVKFSQDSTLMAAMVAADFVGRTVQVEGERFR